MPKRGPPYDDDPGCKYIVIEDPWPGNATGKGRNELYFNLLAAWVRFMLGKEHEAECIFTVNTRNEVIVQLPQDADIVPILGAHPWPHFTTRGDPKDIDRVSYIFAYDYRMKGEPGKHNWQENYPNAFGDPPPHIQFPVKYPYPHVSWASPRNKNCADIALPLPPMRQPTPIPDTSGFTPYQHPSLLISSTVNNAVDRHQEEGRGEQREQPQPPPTNKLGRRDPDDEDAHALQSLRHSSAADVKPRIKTELPNASVKQEQAPYAPSTAFRTAIEELQQARSMNAQNAPQLPTGSSMTNETAQAKREDSGPSESFAAVFSDIRRGVTSESSDRRGSEAATTTKPDPDRPSRPSDSFKTVFNSVRGRDRDESCSSGPSLRPPTDNVMVKQEGSFAPPATAPPSTTADDRRAHVKVEPDVRWPARKDTPPLDSRRARQDVPKRVKVEDSSNGPAKRFKRENLY